MNLLKIFDDPVYIFLLLGFTAIFLAANSYFVVFLPGSDGYACIPGANITFLNVSFAALFSFLSAFLLTGILFLFSQPRVCSLRQKSGLLGVFGTSTATGVLTVFCPVCALPALSLFGVSFGLNFFVEYNLIIKALSLILSFFGLWLVHYQMKLSTS